MLPITSGEVAPKGNHLNEEKERRGRGMVDDHVARVPEVDQGLGLLLLCTGDGDGGKERGMEER